MVNTILSFDVGIKNLSFCLCSYNDGKIEIIDWGIIDLSNNGNVDTTHFDSVMNSLFENLEKMHVCDDVIIENQPVLKNPIMKSLQIGIYSFFRLRTKSNKVKLVSASGKLKPNSWFSKSDLQNIESLPEIAKITNAYTRRKKVSVILLDSLFAKNKVYTSSDLLYQMYSGSKKKDDLADTVLQVMYFTSSAL